MKAVKRADWVHLSSIAGRLLALKKIAAGLHEGRAQCSWNPGSAELELISQKKLTANSIPCKILILNLEEWKKIRLQQREFKEVVPEIIVTDGSKGGKLYLKGARRPHTFESSGIRTVDATGAGDSFAVGYVSARLKGIEPIEALDWGKANAGSVVQHMGAKAGLLTAEQLSKH
jgi:sugar/nucleoside kinase (ribokinase family)